MSTKYIYIDESGDLGLSERSSKVLVISALITDDPKKLDRVIKNARRNKFKKELQKANEIKFNKSNNKVREYLISKLNELNQCRGVSCILYKKDIKNEHGKGDKNKMYDYVAGQLAKEIVLKWCDVEVRIDRSKGKQVLRDDFNEYFELNLKQDSNLGKISIHHSYSENFSGLQLVDILSGTLFQKYNNNNTHFFDLIDQSKFPQLLKELWK